MALDVNDVECGYTREVAILNGVSLEAKDGDVTLVIGPNGAGKSTLLKTIYGYLKPTRGEITHNGRPLIGLRPTNMLKAGIAYLLQGHSVFPSMSVQENLELGCWILRADKVKAANALAEVYQRFPLLKEKRYLPAGLMSGGEQRILEIARLTMTRPSVLILDEPSVGLMPKLVDEVYAEITKLKEERFTILIVDQNIRTAMEIADYVYVLKLGQNSHQGRQREIARHLPEIIKEWV